MDSMAIIQEQKIVQTTVTLSIPKIREEIILETTVRHSISRKDENYG